MLESRRISLQDINTIKNWFYGDVDGLKYVSYYRDVEAWLNLMTNDMRQGWIVSDDGIDIGFIDLEKQDSTGSFAYYIEPSRRLNGYSTKMLLLLETISHEQFIDVLEGYFEPENIASKLALSKAGYFLASEVDSDGMIKETKSLKS